MKFGIQVRENLLFLNIIFGRDDIKQNFGPTIKLLNNFMKFLTKSKLHVLADIQCLDSEENFVLKLKYTLWFSYDLKLKLQLKIKELSENFKNNYHIQAFYFIRTLNFQEALSILTGKNCVLLNLTQE